MITKMKTITHLWLFLFGLILMTGCTYDEPDPVIADLYSDEISFQNSFLSEYLISEETSGNVADRLIWNEVTTVTTNQYDLQASSTADFQNPMLIGITNEDNHVVMVEHLLDLANELGLDDDPATTNNNGTQNNTGTVYFRVIASIGNGGAGSDQIMSEVVAINIKVIEEVQGNEDCDPLYVLGDATVDIGWNFPGKEVTCSAGILRVKVSLAGGYMNFFTTPGDWGSVQDYASFENDGYTIDSAFENSEAGDSFKYVGTPGIYTIVINTNDKTIELEESGSLWAVGDAVPGGWGFNDDTVELIETAPDIWSANIALTNNIFRFFQTFGTWDLNNNYTYYEDQGYTIDPNLEQGPSGDANFNFIGTPGTYELTINAVDKTITLN
jgi:hypothetical protein